MSDVFDDLEERRASGERHDAEDIVRAVLELVLNAKAMPLSASVLVSRDEVADLLQEALVRMPEELRQARWLLKERDAFLAERHRRLFPPEAVRRLVFLWPGPARRCPQIWRRPGDLPGALHRLNGRSHRVSAIPRRDGVRDGRGRSAGRTRPGSLRPPSPKAS